MPISVGDTLPETTFKVFGDAGLVDVPSSELFSGKKVVVFAVPGAFTPTCQEQHLPGFIQHSDAIKGKGVDSIVCVAVNDPFVLKAWSDHNSADGKVQIVSDGNGTFTKAIGQDIDLSMANLGIRSKRYAMIVENGKVTDIAVEDAPPAVEVSGAQHVLAKL